ncbi:MAG: hypothetical protein H0X30_09890 [Anaerolineae bacterium]|nr:hypothetical protein [Anaerolineae bacterium]
MITLTYDPQDSALATRLTQDLKTQGLSISDTLTPGKGNILIAFASPASNANKTVQDVITQAYDNGQHVVVVHTQPAPTPKLINHLKAFDFVNGYPLSALVDQLKIIASPEAGLPLKVLTPKTRVKNRGAGIWLTIIVLIAFIWGLVLVGVFHQQAPVEEYNTVDTEVGATVASIVEKNLPHTTQEAINFPATVQAVPTAQRPLLIETATALLAPRPTKGAFNYDDFEGE